MADKVEVVEALAVGIVITRQTTSFLRQKGQSFSVQCVSECVGVKNFGVWLGDNL